MMAIAYSFRALCNNRDLDSKHEIIGLNLHYTKKFKPTLY